MEPAISPKFTTNCHDCQPVTPKRSKVLLIVKKRVRAVLRADDQSWLGRSIICPLQHLSTFEEFKRASNGKYSKDIDETRIKIDKVFQELFGMDYSNWAQLGNLTVDENGIRTNDPNYMHVHFHLIPRYSNPKPFPFAGMEFIDETFGQALNIDPKKGHKKKTIPTLVMKLLKDQIQQKLVRSGHVLTNEILDAAPSIETREVMWSMGMVHPRIPGCEITLVRHGSTEWNTRGQERLQGKTDIPLDKDGNSQARQLKDSFPSKKNKYKAIYTSTMTRAIETAKIAFDFQTSIPVIQTPLLNEAACGSWEGKFKKDYEEWCAQQPQPAIPKCESGDSEKGDAEIQTYLAHKFDPTVESQVDVFNRFNEFLAQHASKHTGQKIAVFAHGGQIRSIINNCYFSPEYVPVVENCAVVKLFYTPGSKLSISSIDKITWKNRT